jgi:CheY-like chemotaxis protein
VLLLDITMPGMDGFRLLRAIQAKAAAQGVAPPPAVAVTASSMLEEVADYFAAGFAAHLPKPFRRGDLVREISRALRRAPA